MAGFVSLAVLSLFAPPILPRPELPPGALRVSPTQLTSAVEDALKQLELPQGVCVPLLRDEKLPGITEAMIEHAIGEQAPLWYQDDGLREALNQRLGTSFRNLADLQGHLRKNGAALEKQTKTP
jgi:hypothetical protein